MRSLLGDTERGIQWRNALRCPLLQVDCVLEILLPDNLVRGRYSPRRAYYAHPQYIHQRHFEIAALLRERPSRRGLTNASRLVDGYPCRFQAQPEPQHVFGKHHPKLSRGVEHDNY